MKKRLKLLLFLTFCIGFCASAYNLPEFNKTDMEQSTVVTVSGTEYTIWASAYMEVRSASDPNPGEWYPNYYIRFSPSVPAGIIEKIDFDGNLYVHGKTESVHQKTDTWSNPSGADMHTYSHFDANNISGMLDYVGEFKVKFWGIDGETVVRYSTLDKSDEFRETYLTKSWLNVDAGVSGVDKTNATINYNASAIIPETHNINRIEIYKGYPTSGTPVFTSENVSGTYVMNDVERGTDQVFTVVAVGTVTGTTDEVHGYKTVRWNQPGVMPYGINFNGNLNQGSIPHQFVETTAASKEGCTTYAVNLFSDINQAWYANACTLTFKSETLSSENTVSEPVVINESTARNGYIPLTAANLRKEGDDVVADIKVGLGMRFADIYLHVDDATGDMWLSLPKGQRETVDFYPQVALNGSIEGHNYGWDFKSGFLLSYNEDRITVYNPVFDENLTYPEGGTKPVPGNDKTGRPMTVRCVSPNFPTFYASVLKPQGSFISEVEFSEADNTGKGYYERVFTISSIEDLQKVFNREGDGVGSQVCCDIHAPGIAFNAVGYDMALDPETSMPTEVRIRIYNENPDLASLIDPARKSKTSFSVHYWHSDIAKTLGSNDIYFTYDHTDTDEDGTVYDYYVIPVHDDMTGVEPEPYVVQCNINNHTQKYLYYPGQADQDNAIFQIKVKESDNIRFYFDIRNNDTWTKLQRYDERIGNSRVKFGAMAKNIWLRVNTDPNVGVYDKYEIMYDTNGETIDERPAEVPIDNNKYTMLVPEGSPLYDLMRGTTPASEKEITLYFNKHVASDYWYHVNLGRNIKFDVDQTFTFLVNGENQNIQFMVDSRDNIASNSSHRSVIKAGLEGNRLMLHVKYNYKTRKYDYEFCLHKLGDAFPLDWERATDPETIVKHSRPIFKAWTGDDNNNGSDFIDGLNNIASIPKYHDGATYYYEFAYVYKDKGSEEASWSYEEVDGKVKHPNVFYMDIPGGIEVNKTLTDKLNGEGFNFGSDENAAGMDHLAFFNILDEDGYDVANPCQGGQWFYANTWWCANRYVVPATDINGNTLDPNSSQYWIPNMRPKTGTRGDLVYADYGENAKIYGITIFRIAGTKYDMYRPTGAKVTEGNYYYIYFNTDPNKKGPELTPPICLNVNVSQGDKTPRIPVSRPEQYDFYQPNEHLYPVHGVTKLVDNKLVSTFEGNEAEGVNFNKPVFGNDIPTSTEGVAEIYGGWPALIKLDHVASNGDAIYRLDLNGYKPVVASPFTIAAITRTVAWSGDVENDKLRVSKWSRYMMGEGKQANDFRASVLNNTDVTYSQLLIATNPDRLRVQLKSTIPSLRASLTSDYQTDETKWADEPVVYPEFKAEISWVIDSNHGYYEQVTEDKPLWLRLFVKEFERNENGDFKVENGDYTRTTVHGPTTFTSGNDGDYYGGDEGNEADSEAFAKYKITSFNVDKEKMTATMTLNGYTFTRPIYGEEYLEGTYLNEGEYLVVFPVSYMMDASKVNEVYATLSWTEPGETPRKSNIVSELKYDYLTPTVEYGGANAVGARSSEGTNNEYGTNIFASWNANEDVAILPYRKSPEYYYSASSDEWLKKLGVADDADAATSKDAIGRYVLDGANFDSEVALKDANGVALFNEYTTRDDGMVWVSAVSFADSRLSGETSDQYDTQIGYATKIERLYSWPDVPVARQGAIKSYTTDKLLDWSLEDGVTVDEGADKNVGTISVHNYATVAHKIVDYTVMGISGIEDITGEADAPVEYYNLQGVRIENPAAGSIVIRRQGSKTAKVLIR